MTNPPLTEAVYYILLSLTEPLHGYGIMQKAEQLSSGRVRLAAGTLYGALNTLLEKGHEERYRRLLERLRTETVFRQPGETVWLCRNCGHLVLGDSAPQVCPVCGQPQGYFERRAENY